MQKSPNIFMLHWYFSPLAHGCDHFTQPPRYRSQGQVTSSEMVRALREDMGGGGKGKEKRSLSQHVVSVQSIFHQKREWGLSPWAESLPVHTRGLEETKNTPTTMMVNSVLSWVMSYKDFWDNCQQSETQPLTSRPLWRKICVCLHSSSALRFLTENLKGCMSDADSDSGSGQNPSNESNYLLSDRSGQSCLVGSNYRHLYLLKKLRYAVKSNWQLRRYLVTQSSCI